MNAAAILSVAERGLQILDVIVEMLPEIRNAVGDKADLLDGLEDAVAQLRAGNATLKAAAAENRDVTADELDASERAFDDALERLKAAAAARKA